GPTDPRPPAPSPRGAAAGEKEAVSARRAHADRGGDRRRTGRARERARPLGGRPGPLRARAGDGHVAAAARPPRSRGRRRLRRLPRAGSGTAKRNLGGIMSSRVVTLTADNFEA